MKPSLVLFVPLLALAACNGGKQNAPTDPGAGEAWVDLIAAGPEAFEQNGGVAVYEFRDGVLIGKTRPKTPNSFLCTKKTYGDFELVYEFRVDPRLNSGVQIRSNIKTLANGKPRVWGYQVEIDPSDRSYSAGVYEEAGRGWLAKLDKNEAARKAFKQKDWNRVRVLAVGDHIQTWINDVPAVDLRDEKTAEGFIGFQVHSVPFADEVQVEWRNARIRVR